MTKQNSTVCCFGELLLRMALPEDFTFNGAIPYYTGGAELNVATALSRWQVPVDYVTAIPDTYMCRQLAGHIKELGIDTKNITYAGNRVGLYYRPLGLDVKNQGVIYDRAYSSFAGLEPGTIDWDKVLEGCTRFHFSAISPALNKNVALVCKEAVEAASKKGIIISADLNYRSKLWQYGENPTDVMPELIQYCDVLMGNIWAVESLLGIPSPVESSEGKTDNDLYNAALISIDAIKEQFPKVKTVAFTFRLQDTYWALLQHNETSAKSHKHNVVDVADRVGSGDCFMAGLIYGLYHNNEPKDIINFAAAAAVGKLAEAGDTTNQTVEQVKNRIPNG